MSMCSLSPTQASEGPKQLLKAPFGPTKSSVIGYNAALLSRIRDTREVLETLKVKLLVEKNILAKERMAANYRLPVFSFPQFPVSPTLQYCSPFSFPCVFPMFYNNPWVNNVRQFPGFPDQEVELNQYDYEANKTTQKEDMRPAQSDKQVSTDSTDKFKEQILDAEKMCREEFYRMQKSIVSFRRSWKRDGVDSDGSVELHVDEEIKPCRKEHKHTRRRLRLKSKTPPYLKMDDRFSADELMHRYDYWCETPPMYKARRPFIPIDFSEDSAEFTSTTWHFSGAHDGEY